MSYVTDLTHLLDSKGAIASKKGVGFTMADFQTKIVYHTTLKDNINSTYKCFKCKGSNASSNIQDDDEIAWVCNNCGITGFIKNWRGSLWDMSQHIVTTN